MRTCHWLSFIGVLISFLLICLTRSNYKWALCLGTMLGSGNINNRYYELLNLVIVQHFRRENPVFVDWGTVVGSPTRTTWNGEEFLIRRILNRQKQEMYIMEGHWRKPPREVHFWPHLEPTEVQMQEHWICIQKIMVSMPILTLKNCVITNH